MAATRPHVYNEAANFKKKKGGQSGSSGSCSPGAGHAGACCALRRISLANLGAESGRPLPRPSDVRMKVRGRPRSILKPAELRVRLRSTSSCLPGTSPVSSRIHGNCPLGCFSTRQGSPARSHCASHCSGLCQEGLQLNCHSFYSVQAPKS